MLEDKTDLSSNLEWLLQSGKARDESLAKTLVKDQYSEVYRLALSLVDNEIQAIQLTNETLAEAVLQAHRFQVTEGIQSWLSRLTNQVFRRRSRANSPPSPGSPELEAPNGDSERGDPEVISDQIVHLVRAIRRRKRVYTAFVEFAMAIVAIAVVLGLGRATTALTPDPTATAARTPATPESGSIPASGTPRLEVPAIVKPAQAPLRSDSGVVDIRTRIFNSQKYWDTLWADVYVLDYGPPGYVGPPSVERQQAWIDQPNISLLLVGNLEGKVSRILKVYDDRQLIFELESDPPVLISDTSDGLLDSSQEVADMLLPAGSSNEFFGKLSVVGEEVIAGQDALVLDWFTRVILFNSTDQSELQHNQGRYWVDRKTGVILRKQQFDGSQQGQLLKETLVQSIEYDVEIPYRFLDPQRPIPAWFSSDSRGEPIPVDDVGPSAIWPPPSPSDRQPLSHAPAPPGFDSSKSYLSFQWTSLASLESSSGTIADFFADIYFLGSAAFADPADGVCARSPDGRFLTYANRLNVPPYGLETLFWLDLLDFSMFHPLVPELIPGDFAFAPDSWHLAVFGCHNVLGDCGIYIVDAYSGEDWLLSQTSFTGKLAWSPDQEYLAFGENLRAGSQQRLLVLSARTGAVVYDGPFSHNSFSGTFTDDPEWLVIFGLSFPRELGGIESCTEPPEEQPNDQ